MTGHEFDQRLSRNMSNAESSPTQGRGRGGVDVQQYMLSQLSRVED